MCSMNMKRKFLFKILNWCYYICFVYKILVMVCIWFINWNKKKGVFDFKIVDYKCLFIWIKGNLILVVC